jgi:hypothetical protein
MIPPFDGFPALITIIGFAMVLGVVIITKFPRLGLYIVYVFGGIGIIVIILTVMLGMQP